VIVIGHDATVAEWAGRQLGVTFHPPFLAWGMTDNAGTLNGAIIFNDFVRGGNIEISMAGSGVMRRGVFREAARYVFGHLGCSRVTARTRRDNAVARRMLPRAGFRYEATIERYYGPDRCDDALLFKIMRTDAMRWMQ
jgi:RimJ/RimL family protein N-acetyltransferase